MKRSHDEMSTVLLPVMMQDDPRKFKSVLEGLYKLRVIKVLDISKPTAKPIDEIDEPENEDEANETRLNRNNARMLRLNLKDSNNTEICAVETERISELDDVSEHWYIYIHGPVEIRCGNIMLEKRHVTGKAMLTQDEIALLAPQAHPVQESAGRSAPEMITINSTSPDRDNRNVDMAEDWDDGDDDCIIIT